MSYLDVPHPSVFGQYRNTIKTCTTASESTHFEDDPRYPTGVTSHSRPTRRSSRTHADESHHHRSSRPRRSDRPRPHAYPRPTVPPLPLDSPYSSGELPMVPFVGSLSKDAFIDIIAVILAQRAEYNSDYVTLPTYSEPESVFFSVSRPEIPTRDYVRRLVTYTQCSPSAFVVMLIYLDRIAMRNPRLLITPYNMHRLLVTALTLACKTLDDRCFSNVHYAKVGGIPTAREMNRLELQFLSYIEYRLHVSVEAYEEKQRSLESQPPPSSPVSIAFAMTATSLDRDEIQSMVTAAESGSSMSTDSRYRTRTDSSHFPTTSHSNMAILEKWHASRGGVPHQGGKRIRKADMLNPQHMQLVTDAMP